nr:immunoglobulin heavy chain junction region [Mus musculus]MBK4188054.1 immunoglobulin heavy chain junction region [Mus musculus]
CARRSLTGTYW